MGCIQDAGDCIIEKAAGSGWGNGRGGNGMRKLHGKKFIVRTLFSAVLLCALWDLQAAGAADIQARPDAAGTG